MVTSSEHRGLLAPLLTAKSGRSAETLLGPNRIFYLAIGRAKLRGSAKVAFSVANSEIRWAELVTSRTVLTLSVQNGPREIGADLAFGVDLALFILQCKSVPFPLFGHDICKI